MLFETQHPIVKQVAAAVEAFSWGGVSTSWEKSCVTSVAMSDTSLPVVRSTLGLPETLSGNNSDKRTRQDEMDSDDKYLIFCDYGDTLETHFSYALDFKNKCLMSENSVKSRL